MKLSEYVKKMDGNHWTQKAWFNDETGCMCIGAELIDAFTDINPTMIDQTYYWDICDKLGLQTSELTQITLINDQAVNFEDARNKVAEYLESIGK